MKNTLCLVIIFVQTVFIPARVASLTAGALRCNYYSDLHNVIGLLVNVMMSYVTLATSSWLLSLKCAVPTRYTLLPQGVVSVVTVSGNSGFGSRVTYTPGYGISAAMEQIGLVENK